MERNIHDCVREPNHIARWALYDTHTESLRYIAKTSAITKAYKQRKL